MAILDWFYFLDNDNRLVGRRKMGRTTWFDVNGMKKGEWTAEEDKKLVAYINEHGICDWRSLPIRAGIIYISLTCYIYIDVHSCIFCIYVKLCLLLLFFLLDFFCLEQGVYRSLDKFQLLSRKVISYCVYIYICSIR